MKAASTCLTKHVKIRASTETRMDVQWSTLRMPASGLIGSFLTGSILVPSLNLHMCQESKCSRRHMGGLLMQNVNASNIKPAAGVGKTASLEIWVGTAPRAGAGKMMQEKRRTEKRAEERRDRIEGRALAVSRALELAALIQGARRPGEIRSIT